MHVFIYINLFAAAPTVEMINRKAANKQQCCVYAAMSFLHLF